MSSERAKCKWSEDQFRAFSSPRPLPVANLGRCPRLFHRAPATLSRERADKSAHSKTTRTPLGSLFLERFRLSVDLFAADRVLALCQTKLTTDRARRRPFAKRPGLFHDRRGLGASLPGSIPLHN